MSDITEQSNDAERFEQLEESIERIKADLGLIDYEVYKGIEDRLQRLEKILERIMEGGLWLQDRVTEIENELSFPPKERLSKDLDIIV